MIYINAAIDNKSKYTDSLFTYKAPDCIETGDLVIVPFGKNNNEKTAVVCEIAVKPDCPEEKIKEILNGMLGSMIDAVIKNEPVILDFIYGGASVKDSQKSAGLIPLDGQQRLTTLWLLYFYASVLDDISEDEIEILKKFRYETRESANAFCRDLVNGIRIHILEQGYLSKKNTSIIDMIKDDALYRASYDTDPTIVSMINVLKVI